MSSTRIKICGITSVEMANVAIDTGADAIGLVVDVPKSPRCLTSSQAQEIAHTLPAQAMIVAVLQDASPEITEDLPGTWVQLHGDEDEQLIAQFAQSKHVIKGFRFDPEQVLRWNADPHVDVLLIDGSAGGEGQAFDHEKLADMMPQIDKPIILAGGLNATNVAEAIEIVHPFCVDVSSAVESAPGVKDPKLIREFCEAVTRADAIV